jgi:hypothetical protein
MRQTVIHNYYAAEILYYFWCILTISNAKTQNYKVLDSIEAAEILYYFWCILTISNAKTQNYKVLDSIEGYNFHLESIFI